MWEKCLNPVSRILFSRQSLRTWALVDVHFRLRTCWGPQHYCWRFLVLSVDEFFSKLSFFPTFAGKKWLEKSWDFTNPSLKFDMSKKKQKYQTKSRHMLEIYLVTSPFAGKHIAQTIYQSSKMHIAAGWCVYANKGLPAINLCEYSSQTNLWALIKMTFALTTFRKVNGSPILLFSVIYYPKIWISMNFLKRISRNNLFSLKVG